MKITTRIQYTTLDSLTMFKRCMFLSIRNLDAFLTGIGTPIIMMLLFGYVLGGAMNVGNNVSYIDYIVSGIILQCIGQSASTTAISVNNDMKQGIIARFRSMPITRSSVLSGHALAAIIRSSVTTSFVILMALIIGFRPKAGIIEWLIVIGLLLLFILAITWLSIIFGLISNSAEGANAIAVLISVLPYVSSGFVPTESMPKYLRIFAENQPMTPIIESIRSLLLDKSIHEDFLLAIIWCVVILIISYVLAIQIYKRKLSK